MLLPEAVDTMRIRPVAGLTGDRAAFVTTHPFRGPRHTASGCWPEWWRTDGVGPKLTRQAPDRVDYFSHHERAQDERSGMRQEMHRVDHLSQDEKLDLSS
jgi:hypothetical protein